MKYRVDTTASDTLGLRAALLIDRLDRLTRAGEARHGLNPAQWGALRFLARANRYSRTPAALADYLGTTRGTVSQSLLALERKGLIARRQSGRDKRSVDLDLTLTGTSALADDPLNDLALDVGADQSSEALQVLVSVLENTLRQAIVRHAGKPFGVCHTCRYFRRDDPAQGVHRCALINEPLSQEDSGHICVEHAALAS